MNFRCFRAFSILVSSAVVTAALHGAAAQGQTPPPPNQATPPPPAAAQPAPAAAPAPPPTPPAPPDGTPPPPPGPGAPDDAHHAAVTHTNVNLRNGPGTSYTVVTLIPAGSSVEVSGCQSGWCQVVFQGQNGYIIATSIEPGSPGSARRGPPPGYAGPPGPPPPGYVPPPGDYPPGYYPPPYYYGGPYYGPYWGWRHRYWR